jgi:hypothetical protein
VKRAWKEKIITMWYRTAQLGSSLLSLLSDPTLKYLGNLKEQFIDLDNKIQENIKSLDPEQQQNFQGKLLDLRSDLSQNKNNNFSAQDRIENWNILLSEVQNQKTNQDVLVIKDLRNIVENRSSGSFVGDTFVDADKIFKEYLDAKTNSNFISSLKSSSDVMEIANFFLQNSTNPKLSIIKNIINKAPIEKWTKVGEITDLLLNFYLKTKLEQLKDLISKREPLTPKDKLAIDFINSKIIIHSMKIGTNINSLTNKNIFGQLLGSVASTTTDAIEGLQNLQKTDNQIKSLLSSGN